QSALGVTPDQLFSLLEHEIAFYVRPAGTTIPEFSLLLEAPQEQQELSTINTLMTRLARLSGSTPTSAAGGAKSVKFGKYTITYGGFPSRIVITSSPHGVADAASSGRKLPDDATFNEAKAAAGVP